eukprot:gb/GECH01014125.1/.p1 GENE.gb/GECH01014125.1/~~gb/GECH01014125.1/.p1  ORF type:complete len:305 (+),score=49.24 gb/GECH01014125.1/:1-915(+)
MTGEPDPGRVLSIQSHVVRGYVGNRCAVFTLQQLGFEVDNINSVQFSNHTGYPKHRGTILSGDELWDLYQGLEENSLSEDYTHLLTGYIGSATFLHTVLKVLKKLREKNPFLTYVCDPVLGDHGRLYVPSELVEIYKQDLLPYADVLTPNQFEAETLTDVKIDSDDQALKACSVFHSRGVKTVVITSASYGPRSDTHITLIGSTIKKTTAGSAFKIEIPLIDKYFTGTGDLTSSLILAHMTSSVDNEDADLDFRCSCEKTVASVQSVLRRTFEYGSSELKLVQSKGDIENPTISLTATPLRNKE